MHVAIMINAVEGRKRSQVRMVKDGFCGAVQLVNLNYLEQPSRLFYYVISQRNSSALISTPATLNGFWMPARRMQSKNQNGRETSLKGKCCFTLSMEFQPRAARRL